MVVDMVAGITEAGITAVDIMEATMADMDIMGVMVIMEVMTIMVVTTETIGIMEGTGEITGTTRTVAGGITTIIPGEAITAGGAMAGISGTIGEAGTTTGTTGTGSVAPACRDGVLILSTITTRSTIIMAQPQKHLKALIGDRLLDTTTIPISTIFLKTSPASNMSMRRLPCNHRLQEQSQCNRASKCCLRLLLAFSFFAMQNFPNF